MTGWFRRFFVKGVLWRKALHFGVEVVPIWAEPVVVATWAVVFLIWGPGRRGVMRNLSVIKPGSTAAGNFLRTYRVFYNFAWSIADTARFRADRIVPDWDFVGLNHFDALQKGAGGAIILTAHMGNYDLGSHLFSERSSKRLVVVRAPEVDPQTQQFEELLHERTGSGGLRIGFNTAATELALDLLAAVQNGDVVAIQGDRTTPGIAGVKGMLFGKQMEIPAGPFALAMAARVPIFPLFTLRLGRRHYRLLTCQPIIVERTSRQRDDDIRRAVDAWMTQLETVIRDSWYQWLTFEPFFAETPS